MTFTYSVQCFIEANDIRITKCIQTGHTKLGVPVNARLATTVLERPHTSRLALLRPLSEIGAAEHCSL